MNVAARYRSAITTQQYGGTKKDIEGVEFIAQPFHRDDSGNFSELIRVTDGRVEGIENFEVRQASMSVMLPNVIKAFHLHEHQDDIWYVSPYDRVLVVLVDLRENSPTEGNTMRFVLGGGTNQLVRIPAGVAHGAGNLWSERASLYYFVSNQFNVESPDEHRLPWDYFGRELWEVTKG